MWASHIPKRVDRELADAPPTVHDHLQETLAQLQHEPRPSGCKKLKGKVQCWRVRVGAYRILYDILDRQRTIVILKIGPRKDVYRT